MDNLKDRILSQGMTIAEVAERAGTSSAHLYNLLNRVRRPRPELAMAVETACNGAVRAAWLLGLETPPPFHASTSKVA